VVDPEGLVPRPVAAELVVAIRGGVAHDRVRDGLVDLLIGHVELVAVLRRELDVDRLVVTVQEHVPPVGVPLDPLVMGYVHARTLSDAGSGSPAVSSKTVRVAVELPGFG